MSKPRQPTALEAALMNVLLSTYDPQPPWQAETFTSRLAGYELRWRNVGLTWVPVSVHWYP